MIVRTMRFIALFSMFTGIEFVVFRVIFLFFPPMTIVTMILIWAPLTIVVYIRSGPPIIALLF